ncbi:MAG: hypothetical protein U0796_17415 [Gemmatales bacterium]
MLAMNGCGKSSPSFVGAYHVEQDSTNVFGAGAEKIILSIHADKKFDVKAGPVTMLSGTWEGKNDKLTFSQGQGSIVVEYRMEKGKLVPIKDGKDLPNWRWAPGTD